MGGPKGRRLQGELEGCLKGGFKGGFKGSGGFKGGLKGDFKAGFKGFEENFKEAFKGISRGFKGGFKKGSFKIGGKLQTGFSRDLSIFLLPIGGGMKYKYASIVFFGGMGGNQRMKAIKPPVTTPP